MTRRAILGLFLGLFLSIGTADGKQEEKFVVIVNRSNQFDSLSRARLTFLYLRKVSRWPWGAEVDPINLDARDPVRREFNRRILQTTEEQLAEYWIDQRVARGVGPPMDVRDAAAARAIVARRPGAIAYIPADQADGTVKVLTVTP